MIVACFVLAFMLVCSVAMNLAQASDAMSESKRADHWRSLYETSAAGARELRHELTDARNATAKALGQGTRLAKRMHEMSEEHDRMTADIAALEEATNKALADIELAKLMVEAHSKRTAPHGDGGSN